MEMNQCYTQSAGRRNGHALFGFIERRRSRPIYKQSTRQRNDMSAFPWNNENAEQQTARAQYAASLKAQVDQRAASKMQAKQQAKAADLEDDARVLRESAAFAAQAQAEVQAQRDREALVARREADAAARYAADNTQTREQKVAAFQAARQASEAQNHLFGHDGGDEIARQPAAPKREHAHPLYQQSSVPWATEATPAPVPKTNAHVSAAPFATHSESRAEQEAGLARAAASGASRPDQQADSQAAAIKARARGQSSLW